MTGIELQTSGFEAEQQPLQKYLYPKCLNWRLGSAETFDEWFLGVLAS